MATPLISVLLPTYNSRDILPNAVQSIMVQTVDDWHLVIVDDGSTDDTLSYLGALHRVLGPKLTVVWWPQNRGIVHAMNEGLRACEGLYIARMDSDDASLARRFGKQLEYLAEHPEYDGCGSWIEFFGDEDRIMEFPTDPDDVRDQLFERTTVAHPTYFFHRKVYQEFQYDPSYHYAEDVDFLLRVTERYRISNVPEVLLRYRSDYERCRSCEDVAAQEECVRRARAEARKRRKHQ